MRVAWRVLLTLACVWGMWWAYRLLRADIEVRKGTPDGVRAAIGWDPDAAEYYLRLSELEPEHAEALLEKALALDPYNARAAIDLALAAESRGDFGRSERLLQQAFRANRRWLTRWTLANYYFRREAMERFWDWVRKSAEMPAEDLTPLFDLCRRAGGDAERIRREAVTDDPQVLRQFVLYAARLSSTADGQWAEAAEKTGARLAARGTKDQDLGRLLELTDRLVDIAPSRASAVWSALMGSGWIAADGGQPYNGTFARTPLGAGFDWRMPVTAGVQTLTGPAGLEIEFSGKQREECTIAEQVIAPGTTAGRMLYRYRTTGIAPASGLRWEAREENGAVVGASADLSSETEREDGFRFEAKAAGTIRLRLAYKRAAGTKRVSGKLAVVSIRMER